MITVSISINGEPIFCRTAVNTGKKFKDLSIAYKLDDGEVVRHHPDEGAVPLAIKMLRKIKEQKTSKPPALKALADALPIDPEMDEAIHQITQDAYKTHNACLQPPAWSE